MPKFAANLSMLWNELPFLDRFGAAARAGFQAVEFLFPYDFATEEIAHRLRENRLALVLHNMPPGDWAAGDRGTACIPGRETEFRTGVAQALDCAQALGVPQLHCMAGIAPAGVSEAQARATLVANLRHAAQAAREHGIRVLLEPINTFDMPGFFVSRPAQALAILDEVGSDNLFLQYDLYHAWRMGDDLARTLRTQLPRIAHMQLADSPGRHEPGTGDMDYRSLFDLIDELGYGGCIGCEYRPRDAGAGGTDVGLAWVAAHGQALQGEHA
ncbi:hydroxypyruvate isomerase [Hydrogenophaga sp.]|uniref:hydroxypyruvate isomerase n=1 Tax=Hydrogenophaga sp. TaxID=1904254 RepID=UPI00261BF7EA|nr:hydroxypyruvate isomerase [Hydrogenophaga sp.]MCW5654457.1 hydroxypyruvate isomerase [Hydrogenophaga sp.]